LPVSLDELLMWLLNGLAPDHRTVAEFRRRVGAALQRMQARATPELMRLRRCVPFSLTRLARRFS
jgi:hypothetical protein